MSAGRLAGQLADVDRERQSAVSRLDRVSASVDPGELALGRERAVILDDAGSRAGLLPPPCPSSAHHITAGPSHVAVVEPWSHPRRPAGRTVWVRRRPGAARTTPGSEVPRTSRAGSDWAGAASTCRKRPEHVRLRRRWLPRYAHEHQHGLHDCHANANLANPPVARRAPCGRSPDRRMPIEPRPGGLELGRECQQGRVGPAGRPTSIIPIGRPSDELVQRQRRSPADRWCCTAR